MLIWPLEKNETLLWQGRPAPRCYLFRLWPSQLFAFFMLLVCFIFFWQAWQRDASLPILGILLLPLLLFLVLGPLRLGYVRWQWETVFYAATDRRVIIRSGYAKQAVSYPWGAVDAIVLRRYTDHLADIELIFADKRRVVLECIEEPRNCLRALPAKPTNPLGQQHPVFDSDKSS